MTVKNSSIGQSPQNVKKPEIYKPRMDQYFLKMLLYGDPGVGKTTLAASAMDCDATKDVLIINVEGGLLSVVDYAPDVVDLESWAHLDDLFWFLAKGDHNYKTVVIDSLSELQLVNVDSVITNAMKKPGNKRENADEVWLDDYGKSNSQVRNAVRKFRDLPMHVIFTCLAARSQDADKNEQVHPALPPKMRGMVMGYMDVVGFMYTKNVKNEDGTERTDRVLLTQPYGKWVAKDRSLGGRLGITMDNPTISMMINQITGGM